VFWHIVFQFASLLVVLCQPLPGEHACVVCVKCADIVRMYYCFLPSVCAIELSYGYNVQGSPKVNVQAPILQVSCIVSTVLKPPVNQMGLLVAGLLAALHLITAQI